MLRYAADVASNFELSDPVPFGEGETGSIGKDRSLSGVSTDSPVSVSCFGFAVGTGRAYQIFGDIEDKLDVLNVECTNCARKGR